MEKVIAKSGISGSTLKLIAIFTMLIDHIAATVILQMINNGIGGQTLIDIYWVMRSIGRMAFPVFCFLLVEGFKYTHSREKYAARMFIFALISEIPFDLAINNTVLEFKSNNVFFTLLLGLLAIMGLIYTIWSQINMKKKQKYFKELHTELKPGQEVLFAGGIYGTVKGIEGEKVQIKVRSGAVVDVSRYAIQEIK